MTGNIYIITNNKNDKVYIGQTIHSLNTRFTNHKMASRIEDTKFYRAMRKYGEDSFFIQLLEEVPYEQLNSREKYWINYYDSYNNGYNSTLGGDGILKIDYNLIFTLWNCGYNITEIADKTKIYRSSISRILKECFHISEEDIEDRRYKNHYTLSDEELLKYWSEGYTPNQIVTLYGGSLETTKKRLVALGILKEEMDQRKAQNQRNTPLKEVQKLWESGLSMNEIIKKTHSNHQTIKKQLIELGYTEEDFKQRKSKTCNQNKRAVVQLDLQGNYIAQYESAAEAERQTGANRVSISGCCHKKPKFKTAKGYKWMFLEDYNEKVG